MAATRRGMGDSYVDQWGESRPTKHAHSPKVRKEEAAAHRLVDEWAKISAAVCGARQGPIPTVMNELLFARVKDDPKSPLNPMYLTWAADSMMMEARFDEAIDTYRDVAKRYGESSTAAAAMFPYTFEQRASCHERLGAPRDAVAVYDELLKRSRKSPNRALWQFRIGQIEEAAGNRDLAIDAYGRAAKTPGTPEGVEHSIQDLARRSAEYLRSPGNVHSSARALADALASALRRKDLDELARLASGTHFSVGAAGSERVFAPADKVLRVLKSDIEASKVRVDPAALAGSGDKLYLASYGWTGKLCTGMVILLLTRRSAGWQWEGLGVTQLGTAFEELHPPAKREENQALRIHIKAPWPAGQCFLAGGLGQSIVAGGSFLFGERLLNATVWFIASLATDCGFGQMGLYYNQVGHSGTDAFAIDFIRHVRGLPWSDGSGGILALSAAQGMVSLAVGTNPSGSATLNSVEINHSDPLENALAMVFSHPLPQPKYRSKYLHLGGPTLLLVSPMMIAAQGQRLGPIDDTGLSMLNHLHFSLHDRDLMFNSVRPNPMDGQTLNDWEGGKCICSTNVPV